MVLLPPAVVYDTSPIGGTDSVCADLWRARPTLLTIVDRRMPKQGRPPSTPLHARAHSVGRLSLGR